MLVTIEKLRFLEACPDGQAWFEERFPAGTSVANLVSELVASEKPGWLGWLAGNWPEGSLRWRLRLCELCDPPDFWKIETLCASPVGTFAQRIEACKAIGAGFEDVAMCSPVGTLKQRLEACDLSFNPEYFRRRVREIHGGCCEA